MESHVGTINQDLNSRTGPGTTFPLRNPPSGGLRAGDKVFGVYDTATRWFHYVRIVRANGTEVIWDDWASAASTSYMTVAEYTPPPGNTAVNLQITLQDNVATEVIVNGQAWVKPS